MYCFRADDVWGYKLIYFVLHWMMFCIPFDDVLRNKLIYFVILLMISLYVKKQFKPPIPPMFAVNYWFLSSCW